MNEAIVRFAGIDWEETAPHARQKVIHRGDRKFRLLELSPGFEEAEWCRAGHVGLVVSGHCQIQFPDSIEDVVEGDAIYIGSDEESRHRAVVSERPVVFFFVDNVA